MKFLKSIFPNFCISCDKIIIEKYLCQSCKSKIFPISNSVCQSCGRSSLQESDLNYVCLDCNHDHKFYDWHRSLFLYSDPLSDWIYRFKFKHDLIYLKFFRDQILNKYRSFIEDVDYLIPVPLSKQRLRQRGFNQSLEIAKVLSKKTRTPYLRNDLIKIKNTSNQTDLKRKERIRNLKGAFIWKSSKILKNKKIILIDDVFTTGSTLNECAKVLTKEGVKVVFGLTIARRI